MAKELSPKAKARKELSDKQKVFVEHYLRTWNATEAARAAGYEQPACSGYENLRKPQIIALIEARLAEVKILTNEVLARTESQMRGNMADFLRFEVEPSEGDESKAPKVDLGQAWLRGQTHLLKRIEFNDEGDVKKIELYSAQDARRDLAQHLGLFKGTGGNEELPDDEGEFSPEKKAK